MAFEPPSNLPAEGAARWRVVVPVLERKGPVDRDLLIAYCQVWARWRQAEKRLAKSGPLVRARGGGQKVNPLVTVSNQARTSARDLEKRLGLDELEDAGDETPDAGDYPGDPAEALLGPLVTRRELAATFGTHMQTVTKWEQAGLPVAERGRRGKPSRYRLNEVRAWVDKRERDAQATTNGNGHANPNASRAERDLMQAQLARQLYQMRARKLIPVEDVERIWSAERDAVRAKLLAIPTVYGDQIYRAGTLEGLAGVVRVLEFAVRDILRELSEPTDARPAAPVKVERPETV